MKISIEIDLRSLLHLTEELPLALRVLAKRIQDTGEIPNYVLFPLEGYGDSIVIGTVTTKHDN